MNKLQEIFDKTIKENSEENFELNYSFQEIKNLRQFNKSLDLLTELIRLLSETISDAIDNNLVSSGLLNESDSVMKRMWSDAKGRIKKIEEKVEAISQLLKDFLDKKPIVIKGKALTFTRERVFNSQRLVNSYTSRVEYEAGEYKRLTNELKPAKPPYPLSDTFRIYNLTIHSFNLVLDGSRKHFGISIESLPDAREADNSI